MMTGDVLESRWTVLLDPKTQKVSSWLGTGRPQHDKPWQAIFCFHWQVCGATLAFACPVGVEAHILRHRDIKVHLVIQVRHLVYSVLTSQA
jgi:hypothetical protein